MDRELVKRVPETSLTSSSSLFVGKTILESLYKGVLYWKPMRYPLSQKSTCQACHQEIVITRQGTGEPWRGAKDHWYSSDHHCEEMKKLQEINKRNAHAMSRL